MGILSGISSPQDIKNLRDEELNILSSEIRKELVKVVTENGGHLASNLGVVELTIALLRVYNPPKDKIVFDVGHQSYVYKMLTGRQSSFSTLRKKEGISGFPDPQESPYDAFISGHASTAASIGLGMARAIDFLGKEKEERVVCIIGDGAMTGGMAYEALNDMGHAKLPIVVILNDNTMSIDKNVGALAKYFSRLRMSMSYVKAKRIISDTLDKTPLIGQKAKWLLEKTKEVVRRLILPGTFFETLGFHYMGPYDGHDMKTLSHVMNYAKGLTWPVLIHVVTKKGKGYDFAEWEPDKYHGVAPYYLEDKNGASVSLSKTVGNYLRMRGAYDKRICAITAAMAEGTGLSVFAKAFPKQFIDVGIAEQHAAAMAAAMAQCGLRPVLCVYSTFLQRCYDQLHHDIGILSLPVLMMIDRAGFVGEDGTTHQGLNDISMLRTIPNIIIMSPSSDKELERMMDFAFLQNCPVAIRYPKGVYATDDPGEIRKPSWISMGDGEIALIAYGRMVKCAEEIRDILGNEGKTAQVINARFIKPLDEEILLAILQTKKAIAVIEEHKKVGGLASAVMEFMQDKNTHIPVFSFGADEKNYAHAKVSEQWEEAGLLPSQVAAEIAKRLGA